MSILYKGEERQDISWGYFNNEAICKVYKGENLIWNWISDKIALFIDSRLFQWTPYQTLYCKNDYSQGTIVQTSESKYKIYNYYRNYYTKGEKIKLVGDTLQYVFYDIRHQASPILTQRDFQSAIDGFLFHPNILLENIYNMSLLYSDYSSQDFIPRIFPETKNILGFCSYCNNLTTIIMSDNIVDMAQAYLGCKNLIGPPLCGKNVQIMSYAYEECANLIGSPVCGPLVTDFSWTYSNCQKLTGKAVCGDRVVNMVRTYYKCKNIDTFYIGPNVRNAFGAFSECSCYASLATGDNVEQASLLYSALAPRHYYGVYDGKDYGIVGEVPAPYLAGYSIQQEKPLETYIIPKKATNIYSIYAGTLISKVPYGSQSSYSITIPSSVENMVYAFHTSFLGYRDKGILHLYLPGDKNINLYRAFYMHDSDETQRNEVPGFNEIHIYTTPGTERAENAKRQQRSVGGETVYYHDL